MKYLKLFEAFDSLKISKTLGFIDKSYRDKFISDLKSVCNYIDYPLSKLTDDDLEYLPYKRVIDLREDSDRDLFKFWFSKDGEYIGKTVVSKRESGKIPSDNISDYNIISDELSHDEIKNLKTGTLVYMSCSEGSGPGYLYNHNDFSISTYYNYNLFVFQNFAAGGRPSYIDPSSGISSSSEVANYSWNITEKVSYYFIKLIEPKKLDGFMEVPFYISSNDGLVKLRNIDLSKANFAIVLNKNKLKKLSLRDIKSKREEIKKGAFKSDEEIKSENIKRYLNKILETDKIIIDPKIIFRRLLINKEFLFLLRRIGFTKQVNDLNRFYYDIMRSDDEEYIVDQADNMRNNFMNYYNRVNEEKFKIIKNKNDLKESLKKGEFLDYGGVPKHDSEVYLEMIEKLESLSEVIYNKFYSLEMNNLYDVESFKYKFDTLIMYMNSSRNYFSKIYEYTLSYLNDRNSMKVVIFEDKYNSEVLDFNKVGYYRLVELIKRL